MKYTTVNGRNYFNEKSLEEMTERLENGETIAIYIDCIGHTRTENETILYVEALRDRYGDDLLIDTKTAYTALFSLKQKKGVE